MKKLISWCLLGTLFVCSYSMNAQTIYVTNVNNVGPGSLRQTISVAKPGDTIEFKLPASELNIIYVGDDVSSPCTFNIDKDITIDATGLNVEIEAYDPDNSDAIFNIARGSTVTLKHLIISHGWQGIANEGTLTIETSTITQNGSGEDNYGAGIYNCGNLTVINTKISSNSADSDGGGIFNDGGNLAVKNSEISYNLSYGEKGGGGIYNTGTAIIDQNSTITDNEATSGGGIYNSGNLTVKATEISSNEAYNNGGGIYNTGTAIIDQNSTITDNEASSNGGGIYSFQDAKLSYYYGTVKNNSPDNVYIDTNQHSRKSI